MIKVFRLSTGMEVISKVQDDKWCQPMAISITPNKEGKADVGLAPLTFYAKESTVVPNLSHVLFSYEPSVNVENLYTSSIDGMLAKKSGIILPSQSDVNSLGH